MTGEEIRRQIDENNKHIEELLNPAFFVLNKDIQIYMQKNMALRAICKHEFKDRKCIFCDYEVD